jgi:chromosome segregation ATPase
MSLSGSGGLQGPGAMGYSPPAKRLPTRLDALAPVGGEQGAAAAQSAKPSKPKRERRKRDGADDPRVPKLMAEVSDELAKLSSAVPGGMPQDASTARSTHKELAPFLQSVLGQLKETRGRLGAVWIDDAGSAGPALADNSKEMAELTAKMKALEQENARLRRYGQRAKTAVDKLQKERGRMASDLAAAEFKLKEAVAGRGTEADKLLTGPTKKTEKMMQWEKKHGGASSEEARLRERYQEEKNAVDKMRSPQKEAGAAADSAPGEPGFVMQQCNQ